MILREIKNIYIKNRLTEGVDFKRYEWLDSTSGQVTLTINETDFQSLTAYRIGNPNTYFLKTTNPNYGTQYMYFSFESWLPGFVLYNPSESYITIKEQNLQFTLTKNGNNIIYQGNSTITINYPMNKLLTIVVCNNMTRLKSVTTSTGQYIPCKLLQDIPASLSIDNKAYTAGTCGLYYTTTGKFIGSSNLTVEGEVEPETHTGLQQIYQNKLIEGVDYETYDWLRADIPFNVEMMELPVNSNDVEYDLQRLEHGNTTIFHTKNDEYKYFFWQNGYTIGVYDLKGNRDVTYKDYNSTVSLFHIKTDSSSVVFNTINVGVFGFPITNILWHNSSGSNSDITKTSSIKVDGVTRYVPCTLLRSIPHNLDAQCKERVAGECGMIDLISGKFYGNIASSGTFTVENNSE